MYSYEDRLRAVQLYIKLGKRVGLTIRQLGYPTKNALKSWYREYEQRLDLPAGYVRPPRPCLEPSGGHWQTRFLFGPVQRVVVDVYSTTRATSPPHSAHLPTKSKAPLFIAPLKLVIVTSWRHLPHQTFVSSSWRTFAGMAYQRWRAGGVSSGNFAIFIHRKLTHRCPRRFCPAAPATPRDLQWCLNTVSPTLPQVQAALRLATCRSICLR